MIYFRHMEKETNINQPKETLEQPDEMERPPPSRPIKIVVHIPKVIADMQEGKDLYEGDGIIFSYINSIENRPD